MAADHRTGDGLEASGFELGYRPALDGLRAVAIAMVLWHHAIAVLMERRDLPLGGFLGVDVFFVLSGFLITSLLLERPALDRGAMGAFYLRRARRLLPALVVFLVVHGLLAAIQGRDLGQEAHTSLAALLYVANWAQTFGWDLASDQIHLWSLSVEEQFYLLWPPLLALAIARGRGGRRLVPVLAVSVLAIAGWRLVLVSWLGAGPEVLFRTDARADTILVGALLAAAVHAGWWPARRWRRLAGWAGLVVLGFAFLRAADVIEVIYRVGFTVIALAAAGVILASLDGTWGPGRLLARPMPVLVGRLSYSLYLWHLLCFGLVASLYQGPGPARLAVAVAASFACAAVSHRYVERPWLASRAPAGHASGQGSATAAAPAGAAGTSADVRREPRASPTTVHPHDRPQRWAVLGASLVGASMLAAGTAGAAGLVRAREPARAPSDIEGTPDAALSDGTAVELRFDPVDGAPRPQGGTSGDDARPDGGGRGGASSTKRPEGRGTPSVTVSAAAPDLPVPSTTAPGLPRPVPAALTIEVLAPVPRPDGAGVEIALQAIVSFLGDTEPYEPVVVLTLTRPDADDLECQAAIGAGGSAGCVVTSAPSATGVDTWSVAAVVSEEGIELGRGTWPPG